MASAAGLLSTAVTLASPIHRPDMEERRALAGMIMSKRFPESVKRSREANKAPGAPAVMAPRLMPKLSSTLAWGAITSVWGAVRGVSTQLALVSSVRRVMGTGPVMAS